MGQDGSLAILYLGPGWWGSDARALATAFRQRGHALIEVDFEDFLPLHWTSLPLRLTRRLLRPLLARDYRRAVLARAAAGAADLCVVFKGLLVSPGLVAAISSQGIPVYLVYPDVSFHDPGGGIWRSLPFYDCVFTTKSFHLENEDLLARARDLRPIRHGADPAVHRPLPLSRRALEAYACDVSFVGCRSPKKERLLAALLAARPETDLRVWGPGWGRARREIRSRWGGRGAWGDELVMVYRSSRVNLGLLSEAGPGTGEGDRTTARTWQIPASGAFLLHEDTAEVREYFEPGREIDVFDSARALAERVGYYLAHGEERRRMAERAARRCAEAGYDYSAAAEAILAHHSGRETGGEGAR